MQLDIYTVLIASCAAATLLGMQFLYFWFRDRNAMWLAWWASPFLVTAVAIVLRLQRGFVDDFIAIGISNALLFLAFGLAWQGARVFSRRKPLVLIMLIVPAAWLALCAWPVFMGNLGARVVVGSLALTLFAALAAFELWRGRKERLPSLMPAVILLSSLSVFMIVRMLLIDIMAFPIGAKPIDGTAAGIFNFIVFFHTISITVLMISLTKERREAEQRAFAQSDPLTGLANRRAFVDDARRLIVRHQHSEQPLSVLVLDLDHFKSVNDRFGHEAGDRVLIGFASVVKNCLRPDDLFYRMGGEEFCCLLPDVKAKDAKAIAERICTEVETAHFDTIGGRVRATVSVGAASSELSGYDLDLLLSEADSAVYEAKATGRNRAVLGGEIIYRPTVGITRHYAA